MKVAEVNRQAMPMRRYFFEGPSLRSLKALTQKYIEGASIAKLIAICIAKLISFDAKIQRYPVMVNTKSSNAVARGPSAKKPKST
jgi:hypothetical protein